MHKLSAYFAALQSALSSYGPGFSTAVMREGETIFERHHGVASLELQVPLSCDSAYYLASESKQFTAACVLMLVRDGLIGLDTDVCAYLPELSKFEQAFPLRSLLNHSSGIPDYFSYLECQLGRHEADYFNNDIILKLIACMDTVACATLSEHRYSNSNYILLAALIERITGMPLAAFARTRLFEPLGLQHIRFDDDRFAVIERRVCSYESDPARPFGYRQNLGNANTVGDGGIYASTRDLLRWEREWHRQWADRGSLLHAMLQPSPLLDGSVPSYRFGLEIKQWGEHAYVFHEGGLWGFNSLIVRIPHLGMSVIHLANCEAAQPDVEQILASILD